MREGDVAGRCSVGRVWWCAMPRGFFWCDGFHTSVAQFCRFNQNTENMIPFHAIWGLCWHSLFLIFADECFKFP